MESSTHVYYSDEMDDRPTRITNKKQPGFVETGLALNKRFDDIDDDDDGDRSSSGKYYSIKSNNNFSSSALKENVESAATTKGAVYPCLSTFGRHKLAVNPRIKTNPTQGLVLNVNNLRNNSGGMSEVIANSLTNSSSHSVESAASLTRSSNHYNEPDVYFTSSYCRLVPSNTCGNNNNGLEKTSSKIFPRTNPMFRNYGGGSSLKLDFDSNVTTNTNGVNSAIANKRPNDFIDVCSKL